PFMYSAIRKPYPSRCVSASATVLTAKLSRGTSRQVTRLYCRWRAKLPLRRGDSLASEMSEHNNPSPTSRDVHLDVKPNVIRICDLHKTYKMGDIEVHALRGINVTILKSEFVAVMGASGSGKSTIMNIVGCLDRPTRGAYFLEGQDVSALSSDEWAHIRNRKIGFVF